MIEIKMLHVLKKLFSTPKPLELQKTSDLAILPSINRKKVFRIIGAAPTLIFSVPQIRGNIQINYHKISNEAVDAAVYLDNAHESKLIADINRGMNKNVKAKIYFTRTDDIKTITVKFFGIDEVFALDCTFEKAYFIKMLIYKLYSYFKMNKFSLRSYFMLPKYLFKYSHRVLQQISNLPFKTIYTKLDSKTNEIIQSIKIQSVGVTIIELPYHPVISVIMPVYNAPLSILENAIQSVLRQSYPHWELCIADDASTNANIRPLLEKHAATDKRIKVVFLQKNCHISASSNAALSLASGEFIALLDHDDALSRHALLENAKLLNQHPDADMIYSDEDKVSDDGEVYYDAFFKPEWSPDYFMTAMYTCHLGVYRASLIKELGGFREGFEGSQDYDLVLRLTEKTQRIYHIPKILYHWRATETSEAAMAGIKSYAQTAAVRALTEALIRRGEKGDVIAQKVPGTYYINYALKNQPLISIIIPTRDGYRLFKQCLQSIFQLSTYRNFEVIVVDNGSRDRKVRQLFEEYQKRHPLQFSVLALDIPFNFSRLNNEAVRVAKGELLLFLNNDTKVITKTWLENMAGFAMRDSIGAVGAMLLYPDNTIQHVGVIAGIGGIANHGHKHFDQNSTGYFSRLMGPSNYSAVTAACLMLKKRDFLEVGGFEEELAVAYNDVDLCFKLLRRGKYNVVLPQVKLYHFESKTRGSDFSPQRIARFNAEQQFMRDRWSDIIANDRFYSPHLTRSREDFSVT